MNVTERKINSMRAMMEKFDSMLGAIEEENEELRTKIEWLQDELDEANKRIEELEMEINELERAA